MKKLLIACLLFTSLAHARDKQDHPLFSAYPGATIRNTLVVNYEQFELPPNASAAATPIKLVGDLYQHFYIVKNISTLKLYKNYQEAAKQAGFSITFSCETDACGSEDDASEVGNKLSIEHGVYNYYHKPYYLLTQKKTDHGNIYAAWFIGGYEDESAVQQVIVEEKPLENNLITVNKDYLNQNSPPVAPVNTATKEDLAKDHPLLPRYPGASLRKSNQTDYETVSIPFPATTPKSPLKLTGDLSQHFYIIKNTSTLKVYENYTQALNKAGFTFLNQCELNACGTENQASELGGEVSLEQSVYNYYRKPYYLIAKKSLPTNDIYVALFFGGYEDEMAVQQIILETEALQNDLITVDADSLKQQLDATGKALIYGVFFDTGKADIKDESTPTLEAITELLKKDTSLSLYVVGHTDDTGSNTANLSLSEARAKAVVTALTQKYQIASSRLQAAGVGPYSPEATNANEAGRKLNRRVELVKRLTTP